MSELEDLFDLQEPYATFHDGDLLSVLPPGALGWYLFFSDWNAFAYCGAESARFEWA
jgi:hypothetical protein